MIASMVAAAVMTSADWEVADRPEGAVRFLVWNIQRGSKNFDKGPEKALDVVKAVDPDVALLQESYDIDGDRPQLGIWMADQLDWHAHQATSPHLNVLSRWKPTETFFHADWHGLGARFEPTPGQSFVAYSIWIDYRAYVTYHLRDNPDATDEELLECETKNSSRFDQAKAILAHLREKGHDGEDEQVFVGGDWNCPSHLDWTKATAEAFPLRRALDLPVSKAVHKEGFTDTFRVVHPDPVKNPANTWSPLFRSEAMDRIDRLYTKGSSGGKKLVPVQAFTLPWPYEDADIEQADRKFPSDHSAVVIDFVWK
jgi:exonuclease III